jgi:hypothetical protein
MVLDENTVNIILNAVHVAKLFSIESFIIEPNIIRGINEDRTAAILTECDINIGCKSIGINRMDVLLSRLNLVSNDAIIECHTKSEDMDADKISITTDRLNLEYSCANTLAIKAPTSAKVNDLFEVSIEESLVNILKKGRNAMKTDVIMIMCDNNSVQYKLQDENNDKLLYNEGFAYNLVDNSDINFVYKYPIKSILSAFTDCDAKKFYITERGMIKINTKGIDLYIPQKS